MLNTIGISIVKISRSLISFIVGVLTTEDGVDFTTEGGVDFETEDQKNKYE